nr:antibiotic biosynthesis monooxygenase [Paraburkholderia sp. Ac-20347]
MRHSCFATLRNRTGKLVVLASSALIAASAFAATPDAASNALPYSNLSTLHVKASQLQPFLQALRHNAAHARDEAGNLSFTVFQSTTSPTTLYVLEQWKDQAAYEAHMKQPALLEMHQAAKADLDGGIAHMRIIPATPDAGIQPKQIAQGDQTSNVLVFLSVKPAESAKFHEDVAAVSPTFRAAPGNVSFEVYQNADDKNEMVQLERWTSEATHQDNLKRPVIQQIRSGYAITLAKPMLDGRVLLKDVTDN